MLTPDYKKYNPPNFSPENLFRPPTSPLRQEFQYLIRELSGSLYDRSRNIVRVGTELEILFFSPDADPSTAPNLKINPNYAPRHRAKMIELEKYFETISKQRPSEFLEPEILGRVSFEIRTVPQKIQQYWPTLEHFGKLLRKKCKELDVLPIVYSQHIHLSMKNRQDHGRLPSDTYLDSDIVFPDRNRVFDAFSRLNPLVLLPEEWERRYCSPYILNFGKVPKNSDKVRHQEFRKLSSEYAHDPTLNLLLCLYGMYDGCFERSSRSSIDDLERTYEQAIEMMNNDNRLKDLFGHSTLSALTRTVQQYPAVSERRITINQVKMK